MNSCPKTEREKNIEKNKRLNTRNIILYKDQVLNPPEFKDHQYWILKN